MKTFLLVALTSLSCLSFANEAKEEPQIEALASPYEEDKSSYSYIKFSTSIFYQQIGFGKRTRYLSTNKANDLSLSLTPFPILYPVGYYNPLLTFEYSRLIYSSLQSRSYKGFSGSISIAFTGSDSSLRLVPIPNLKYIFGKERIGKGFTQFGINLAPAVGALLCLSAANSKKQSPYIGKEAAIAKMAALFSAGCLFEFTVGL